MITVTDHGSAAHAIAAAITGRQHYVLTGMATGTLADALTRIPHWIGYAQNAPSGPVLTIAGDPDHAALIAMAGLLAPAAIVITIPKATTPGSALRGVLGDAVPEDGSRDLIFLDDRQDGLYRWPTLLVDAIAINDPESALDIRLADITAQN